MSDQTTNDEQAKYRVATPGKAMEQPKREELLSDEAIEAYKATAGTGFFAHELARKHNLGGPAASFTEGAVYARSRYENLIASGELMVVKTAHWKEVGSLLFGSCSECSNLGLKVHTFCPGCGAKIVEA